MITIKKIEADLYCWGIDENKIKESAKLMYDLVNRGVDYYLMLRALGPSKRLLEFPISEVKDK
jgi:hypothetical protein